MFEAISDYFVVLARNCLVSTLDYIVMQMRKTNRGKGYCHSVIESVVDVLASNDLCFSLLRVNVEGKMGLCLNASSKFP